MATEVELLEVEVREGVRTIMIHHRHTACIMTIELSRALARAVDATEADDAMRVIVFRSADPDYFIAHFDVLSGVVAVGMAPIRHTQIPLHCNCN